MSPLRHVFWIVGCLVLWACNSGGGSGGGTAGATSGGSGGSGGSSSSAGSANGGGASGGSATGGSGGSGPFTGRCAWPGTQIGILKGVDANNDVYFVSGEELRRVRCIDGVIESDVALATPWKPTSIGGDGLIVTSNVSEYPDEHRIRRFGESDYLWTTTESGGVMTNPGILVAVHIDPTTGEATGIVALNADGSERWKLDIPPSADFKMNVSRPGFTMFLRKGTDQRWLLTSLDPDGTALVSDVDVTPALAQMDATTPTPNVLNVTTLDGTQLGITTQGGVFAQGVVDLQGNLLRKHEGMGLTGPGQNFRTILTSRGVLFSTWIIFKPLEGKTYFGGSSDFAVVALGASGVPLWGLEFGTPAQDSPVTANSDDYGELLVAGRFDQEVRVMRLDPQTGQEIGGTGPGTPCAGPTTFNGQLNTPCAPRSGSPTFECATSGGSPVAAKCNTSTCLWEGEVCTGTSQCPAACNGVTACLGRKCGI